jgi:hypothetical protein
MLGELGRHATIGAAPPDLRQKQRRATGMQVDHE